MGDVSFLIASTLVAGLISVDKVEALIVLLHTGTSDTVTSNLVLHQENINSEATSTHRAMSFRKFAVELTQYSTDVQIPSSKYK